VKGLSRAVGVVAVGLMSCGMMGAQTTGSGADAGLPNAPVPQVEGSPDVTLKGMPKAVLVDQKSIWTSPARIRRKDLVWLAPLAAATGVAIATDHYTMSSVVSHDASFNGDNVNASNVLIGGFIAAPVALFGVGQYEHDAKAREAGLLGGEALLDGVVVEQGMKLVFWRERPAVDGSRGLFFQGDAGWDSSFPSSHATLAWSSAAVIAGEYRSPWVQASVYTLATGVSLTRVLGQQHFPTDVLVGSAAGWLIGHYVVRSHHRQALRK
jgi:membrane-associated phospholipid phosphatase